MLFNIECHRNEMVYHINIKDTTGRANDGEITFFRTSQASGTSTDYLPGRRTLCSKEGFDVAVVRMASGQIHQSHFLATARKPPGILVGNG